MTPEFLGRIAIVCLPRSGSTWITEVIFDHLSAKFPDAQNLNEYFNVALKFVPSLQLDPKKNSTYFELLDYEIKNEKIEIVKKEIPREISSLVLTQEYLQKTGTKIHSEISKRINLLKKAKTKHYILKCFPLHVSESRDLKHFLTDNHHIIMLERKNKREQILSFCYARATGIWHAEQTNNTLPNKVVMASRQDFDFILNQLSLLQKLKDSLKNYHSIFYEDLLSMNSDQQILKAMGLDQLISDCKKSNRKIKTERKSDYLEYFSNRDELLSWLSSI